PSERRPADLNELVERALMVARHRFAGDADALLDLASGPRVVVDPARLIQAVALLIAHAADVADSGGVTIRTSAAPTGVTISSAAPGAGGSSPPFVDAVRAAVAAEGGRLELAPSGFAATLALPRLEGLR